MNKSRLPDLESHAKKIVHHAARPGGDLEQGTFTMAVARSRVEKAMGLNQGELGGKWKVLVKQLVQDALLYEQNRLEDEGESEAGSSTSPAKVKAGQSRAARASNNAKATEAKPTMKTTSKSAAKRTRSPSEVSFASISDDERYVDAGSDVSVVDDESPRRRAAKPSNRKREKRKGEMSKAVIMSEGEVEDEELESREHKTKIDSTSNDEIHGEGKSDTEMSSVYDIPPAHSRSKSKGNMNNNKEEKGRPKSASAISSDGESHKESANQPASKRKRKDPNAGLSLDEAKLADLKRIIVACGVRKQWAKEFADCSTIAHVHRLLSALGMKGTPTLGKAKSLKAKRELEAELDDVRTFEKARGVGSERASRSRASISRSKGVDPDDTGEDEDEDEDEENKGKSRQSALGAVLDFLRGETDSD